MTKETDKATTSGGDFIFHKRFDSDIASEGVWFEVVDELGNEWGSFRCALIDRTAPRWKIAFDRLRRKYKGKAVKDETFEAELFVTMSLLDWKLPSGHEFDEKNALAYFKREEAKYVLIRLGEYAENVRNYQPDEDEEATGKNS